MNHLTPNSLFSPVCFPLYHISRAVAAGKQWTTPNNFSVRLFSIGDSSQDNYTHGLAGTMHSALTGFNSSASERDTEAWNIICNTEQVKESEE